MDISLLPGIFTFLHDKREKLGGGWVRGGGADPDPSALLRRGGILKHTGYKRQGKKSSTKGKDDLSSG